MNANLFAALQGAFPADLDGCAIECADGPSLGLRYSWRDLERGSAMLANLLLSLDLPAGSRIAAQTAKSVEALMLYLAVLRAGYVYLPLNPAYQAAELDFFLRDAEPAVLVCAGANFGWASKLAFLAGTRYVFSLNEDRSGSLLQRAASMSDEHSIAERADNDLAAIVYTSGTTGRSKGALLSHANLLSNARTLKDLWGWRIDDVLIHTLPIFHVHGLFVASHGALLAGAKMIWFNKFEPRAVIARFAEATVLMGVPTLYLRMLGEAALTPAACAPMRLFISGSAPLLLDTFTEWRRRSGQKTILERYGMSETLMLTSNPYRALDGDRLGGTVGPAVPGVEVRVSKDGERLCAPGEIGAIEVRGPNVFAGYWRMPEKTQAEFSADGWFKTGDVGFCDANGYYSIVGRSKDLIISGGFNVYPAEIEGYLNELDGVAESAVIGLPHADFGEAVVAVLVAKPNQSPDGDALIAKLKRQIAGFKVPKQVFIVEELPRNAMGKVQKNRLREQYRAWFA
ncbi:malonyl-CoA synthase [Roseateles sp.]|uniref:malonate--CoA ligase n=1 Tax=Roseateles sp. TaxID=1971397 RepID=UPI00286CE0A4|nr:malonyl-CoA synthase [Roseateles sp.]